MVFVLSWISFHRTNTIRNLSNSPKLAGETVFRKHMVAEYLNLPAIFIESLWNHYNKRYVNRNYYYS